MEKTGKYHEFAEEEEEDAEVDPDNGSSGDGSMTTVVDESVGITNVDDDEEEEEEKQQAPTTAGKKEKSKSPPQPPKMTKLELLNVQLKEAVRHWGGKLAMDVDQLGEAFGVLVRALGEAVRHTLLDVELEDDMADARDRGLRGSQLLQNRDAGSRLLDHLANSAELPFNPLQTRQHITLMIVIQRVRARTVRGVDYSMRLGRGRTSPVVTHSLLTYAARSGNVYREPGRPSADRRH